VSLSIFDRRVGDGNLIWPRDQEAQAMLAIDVLDAVQTVVDVLVDGGDTYRASFAPEATAHTDFGRRNIVVSSKPLREGGRPLSDIIDIITGFVVHEVGHTKLDDELSELVAKEWPNKVVPQRLSNILQDVRLERFMVSRFPGLAGVFDPTFDWVAAQNPYTEAESYGVRIAERVNFAGAVIRYRKYVTFATDATTQAELVWWEQWGDVAGSATNDEMLRLVREGIDHIHVGADTSTPPPPTGPGPEGPVLPPPTTTQPPTEAGPDDDEGGCQFPGGSDPEGSDEPGDDADEPGGDDGSGDSEPDDTEGEGKGEDKPGGDSQGGGDTEGGGDPDDTDTPVDPFDRPTDDGPMGKGGGGDGGRIAEATPDDVDEGLEPDKLDKTMDELAEGSYMEQAQDRRVQVLADQERGSERIKAGIYGTMKVRVNL